MNRRTGQLHLFLCLLVCFATAQLVFGQTPADDSYAKRMLALESNPDDHPVFLMKLIKWKPNTNEEIVLSYFKTSIELLRKNGGEIIFFGTANPFAIDYKDKHTLFGFKVSPWEYILIERYRSRKDIRQLTNSEPYRSNNNLVDHRIKQMEVYALNSSPRKPNMKRSNADTIGPIKSNSDNDPILMLNLVKFKPEKESIYYDQYAKFALRCIYRLNGKVLLGLKAEKLLRGAEEYDRVILVEYPSKEVFTQMILSDEYQAVSPKRTEALEIGHLFAFSDAISKLNLSFDE